MAEQECPRPDWAVWGNMADALLVEAVLLSLNIDPRIATQQGSDRSLQNYGLLDKVQSRLAIANSHLNRSLPFSKWHQDLGAIVNLATFRKWGESLPVPFKFPKRFPGLGGGASNNGTKVGSSASADTSKPASRKKWNEEAILRLAEDRKQYQTISQFARERKLDRSFVRRMLAEAMDIERKRAGTRAIADIATPALRPSTKRTSK